MKKFQVAVTVTASGYVGVEAPDAQNARETLQRSQPEIIFADDINVDLFDGFGDVTVEGVSEEVEEEDENQDGEAGGES